MVDRIKDVINTGGVLVASREVEDALFTHPAVAECAVIAIPDPRWIEAIAAVVVLRDGAAATEDALIAHARQTLAPFKLPKRVFFADHLPKNTAGKLLKRELRKQFSGQAGAVMGAGVTEDWRTLNRANWDERVAAHLAPGGYDLTSLRAGTRTLGAIVDAELPAATGLRVLHLQCHFGLDTLVLAQRGAEVTGWISRRPGSRRRRDWRRRWGCGRGSCARTCMTRHPPCRSRRRSTWFT